MQKKSKSDFQLQKYISNFTDEKIDFKLFLEGDLISKIKDLKTPDGQCLYKLLNLESSLSTNNMHLFDSNQKIKKFFFIIFFYFYYFVIITLLLLLFLLFIIY